MCRAGNLQMCFVGIYYPGIQILASNPLLSCGFGPITAPSLLECLRQKCGASTTSVCSQNSHTSSLQFPIVNITHKGVCQNPPESTK